MGYILPPPFGNDRTADRADMNLRSMDLDYAYRTGAIHRLEYEKRVAQLQADYAHLIPLPPPPPDDPPAGPFVIEVNDDFTKFGGLDLPWWVYYAGVWILFDIVALVYALLQLTKGQGSQ